MPQTAMEVIAGTSSPVPARSPSQNCARIKDLGFTSSKHIEMYGEHFEIVSEPFTEGDCVAVHVISRNDPEPHPPNSIPKIRTLRLPTALLVARVFTIDQSRQPSPGILAK